jgi:predicted DNA-binding transcriptional regulator AlpA
MHSETLETGSPQKDAPKTKFVPEGYGGVDFPSDRLLRVKEVAAALACSVASVWRRVADGTIPQPVKIGGMTRWPQSEITSVIERAKTQRETA